MEIKEYLKNHRILTDGATGTYYASIKKSDSVVVELANISEPECIIKIHKEYIEAGANLFRTNTFAANTVSLQIDSQQRDRIIKKACQLAKKAVEETKNIVETPIFIAGNIGPIPEIGEVSRENILQEYKEICNCFLDEGIEIFLFETFSSSYYLKEIVSYLNSKKEVFVITDFCLNKNGYTAAGIHARRLLTEVASIEGIDACGFNCGIGSGHMKQILQKMKLPRGKYLVAMPNAGYPEQLQNRMVFMENTSYFIENMKEIGQLGIGILGGCCGTTPEYIRGLKESLDLYFAPSYIEGEKEIEEEGKIDISLDSNPFYEKLKSGKKVIAVELDPPYDADYDKIIECGQKLKQQGIDIITLADSPMGRSRVDSVLMSVKLKKEIGLEVMPHVACRDKNMIAIRSTLLGAYINDIRNLLIVTGDPVPSVSRISTTSVFDYNSIRLMEFVKEMNEEHFSEEALCYGGALNYGRGLIDKVVERMEKKIQAGAKYFLTQPIYADEDIERIRQLKERVDTKILCGIMPFVSYRNANFVKNEITGIYVPDQIVERYREDMSKEEAEQVGADIANEIIQKLSSYADGYYFMLPFNRVSLMDKIKLEVGS